MLIGKNVRRVSHNLIISKYFEEENNEIQNQYFIRNIADELSVISLGLGGFFVVINPCSFDIEYSTDTFDGMNNINLVEVEKFDAKAATVFRIEDQKTLPTFNFEYIREQLELDEQRKELDEAIDAITGVNAQYGIEQGSLGTSFDSIELNVEALNAANYKHLDSNEYKAVAIDEEADELAIEIARRKQELEILNQELAIREEELFESLETSAEAEKTEAEKVEEVAGEEESVQVETNDAEYDELSNEMDELNDFLDPEDLFAQLGMFEDDEDETEAEAEEESTGEETEAEDESVQEDEVEDEVEAEDKEENV